MSITTDRPKGLRLGSPNARTKTAQPSAVSRHSLLSAPTALRDICIPVRTTTCMTALCLCLAPLRLAPLRLHPLPPLFLHVQATDATTTETPSTGTVSIVTVTTEPPPPPRPIPMVAIAPEASLPASRCDFRAPTLSSFLSPRLCFRTDPLPPPIPSV